jgi:hypothetical protein
VPFHASQTGPGSDFFKQRMPKRPSTVRGEA